jgi:hypothetical protein
VYLLGSVAPEELPDMEQLAEPEVRSAIEGLLFRADVKKRDFDSAMSRVSLLGHSKGFPFNSATELMLALPDERTNDRKSVFFAGLQSYREFPNINEDGTPRHDDMATFILRFWKQMPQDVIGDAADLILKNAQATEKKGRINLTLKNYNGEVNLDSAYKMRLFELLPILRELRPAKARELERDQSLNDALNKFPNGLQSFEPAYANASPEMLNSMSITYSSDPASRAQDDREEKLLESILRKADSDLSGALLEAYMLSTTRDDQGSSPRVKGLEGIIRKAWKKDPTVARSALKQDLEAIKQLDRINRFGHYLDALAIYDAMGEKTDAARVLDKISSLASELYPSDSGGHNPNLAIKLEWPSTTMWRAVAVLDTEMAPTVEPDIMERIQDDEILLSLQIAVANDLLGNPPGGMFMTVQQYARTTGERRYVQIPRLKSAEGS